MNDLVKFSGGAVPATTDDLLAGLKQTASQVQSSDGVPLLRLLKSGWYVYGPENIEMQEDSKWALNPYSIHHGFCCWVDSELVGEVMVPFTEPLPAKRDLPEYGEPWGQQYAMILRCMSGEDEGIQVLYKGSSLGLRNAIRELINEQLIPQITKDPEHCVPIIVFDTTDYQHKKHGQIFTPVLKVVGWASIEGDAAPAEAKGVTQQEEKPPAGNGAEEPAAPQRRRRRRATADDDNNKDDGNQSQDDPPPRRRRRRRAAAE